MCVVSSLFPLPANTPLTRDTGIIYISLPLPAATDRTPDPEALLRPYLAATAQSAPLWSAFYVQHAPPAPPPRDASDAPTLITPAALPPAGALPLPEAPDRAAEQAERVFWEVVRALRGGDGEGVEVKEM